MNSNAGSVQKLLFLLFFWPPGIGLTEKLKVALSRTISNAMLVYIPNPPNPIPFLQ